MPCTVSNRGPIDYESIARADLYVSKGTVFHITTPKVNVQQHCCNNSGGYRATFYKRMGKWGVWIRGSFHKPIHKTFVSKLDAQRWARETKRLIKVGQYVDLSEANKTILVELLERYEREVSSKKRSTVDKYLIKNIK